MSVLSGEDHNNGLVEGLQSPKINVMGSIEPISGQIFGGVVGASMSTGVAGDPLNINACAVTTTCIQFGLGVYAGAGFSGSAGIANERLKTGVVDSWGVFGNIGAFGTSLGGSVNFGDGSTTGAKGFYGVGKGVSGGVQFCRASLSCVGD